MRSDRALFIITLTLLSCSAFAGWVDELGEVDPSKTKTCIAVSDSDVAAAVKGSAQNQFCKSLQGGLSSQLEENLAPILKRLEGDASNAFFALLAAQHSEELNCAGEFAQQVVDGNPELTQHILNKFLLLREHQHG